ncbi:cytosolic endo-beta-N-acetylglucosaminidase [Episyrphus balteatus]|uniref:cytosolic endo-beta-N-acetylglucosaminidase n=1 Tax=Episyrphus balteatus TaxID=286459 RepID=UPI0024861509|nr:cytosolic endo-beta-N-acetylglucosaminidase [Episyrphus balteatus]
MMISYFLVNTSIAIQLIEWQLYEICLMFTSRILHFASGRYCNSSSVKEEGKCCDKCDKLEARPIVTNKQLWEFDIRSKDIDWRNLVVPLAPRQNAVYLGSLFPYLSSSRDTVNEENKKEVLVCHDMMGNYLEDRHYHSSTKYDDYRFFHWSGVDYFCYFSHKYITIPPCGWINAAHSHGVKVLGTYITESSPPLEEMLRTKESIDATIEALVKLCKHFCFEGWLLNIECRVAKQLVEKLFYFVEQLRARIRSEVENGIVFWYDSVIDTGDLSWQNEINDQNVRFFKLSDATLINYTWNEKSLVRTANVLRTHGEPATKSFFGIDIFGRGQVAKFQTKQTLAKLSKTGFSYGFFAPAWTFETLSQFGYDIKNSGGNDEVNEAFLLRNDKFWWSLWEYIPTHPYISLPLYTDFCVGSGKAVYKEGRKIKNGQFFSLSKQSLQPSVPLYNCVERNFDNAFNGGSSLKVIQSDISFRLFTTDYPIDGTLIFAYAYKLQKIDGELDYILRLQMDEGEGDCLVFLGDYFISKVQPGRCYLSAITDNYVDALKTVLDEGAVDLKIPVIGNDEWKIRYYVLNFDTTVHVKDVGVLFRKAELAKESAYLGAVYLNNIESITLPQDSNAMYLKIKEDFLMH